jgi:hypothetical protein
MAELILSGWNLNQGRIAINNWYSGGSSVLSSTTNNTLLNTNSTTTVAPGVTWGIGFGKGLNLISGAYTTGLNGSGNSLSNNFSLIVNGRANTASNIYSSIVNGKSNISSNQYSLVVNGKNNTSSGNVSLVVNGKNNISSGNYSAVLNGQSNTASSFNSTVINGQNNSATGAYSFIGNGFTNSIQNGSNTYYTTILNGLSNKIYNTFNAQFSTILGGSGNNIKAKQSLAFGSSHNIQHDYTIAFGTSVNTSTMGAISKQMIFANGGNATVRIDFGSGKIYTDAGATFTPADYAEYFEWEDGNQNEETRYGLAVSLVKNGKIKIGNENIIGIVSSAPGIIGDAAELGWKNKYLVNEWGQVVTELFYRYDLIRETNENQFNNFSVWVDSSGNQYFKEPQNNKQKTEFLIKDKFVFSETEENCKRESVVNLISDEYDESKEYKPRSQRKEFSPIGLLGKLRVKTSETIISDFIDFDSNGMAINGKKYRVIENIKDYNGNYGIVKIFFK